MPTYNLAELRQKQIALAHRVRCHNDFDPIRTIAGIDVSGNARASQTVLSAAVVVLAYDDLRVLQVASGQAMPPLPYIPGLLAFREIPAILNALSQLDTMPDLLVVDGHGYSHPKHCGIASHLGALLDTPTIGVAKTILVGKSQPLADHVGAETPLLWHDETIAILVRSRRRAKPIIVSAGHRIDLPTALQVVKRCLSTYRLPEPTRLAHYYSNQARLGRLI